MNMELRKLVIAGGLLVLLCMVSALPKEDDEKNKVRFPKTKLVQKLQQRMVQVHVPVTQFLKLNPLMCKIWYQETRSPAIDNEDFSKYQDEQPVEFSLGNFFSGRVGKFFNDFLQFPAVVFRFVTGIIANQPFAKLREEVRNLNISYPK